MPTPETPSATREIPGRYVVLGLLAFGMLSTAGIWTYWKLHLAPFMPLQKALVQAYPGSSPRVEGGRTKTSQRILRIVLTIEFPPEEGDPRVQEMIERIVAIAREHLNFADYEDLEIFLVHRPPEKSPQQYEYRRSLREMTQQ